MTSKNVENKIERLTDFLTSDYGYSTFYDHDRNIRDLVKDGYLRGRSITDQGIKVSGFFSVTDLGKEWLYFQKL